MLPDDELNSIPHFTESEDQSKWQLKVTELIGREAATPYELHRSSS